MKYHINSIKPDIPQNETQEPTLLFLNYWGSSTQMWKFVMEPLKHQFRCLSVDYRREGKPIASYRMHDLADHTLHFIKSLKLENYVLIGHDLDGKLAQFIASQRPGGLEALILVTPALPVSTAYQDTSVDKEVIDIALQEDISGKVDKIEVPTLVLAGDADTIECSEVLIREVIERIPDAEFQIVPNSGHQIPLEAPTELASSIFDFLAV